VEDTPILDLINEVQRSVTGADLSAASAFPDRAAPGDRSRWRTWRGSTSTTTRSRRSHLGRAAAGLSGEERRVLPPLPRVALRAGDESGHPRLQLRRVSGVDYTLDISPTRRAARGAAGAEWRPVAPPIRSPWRVNNYRASGAGGFNMLAGAPVVYDRERGIRELLIREIERRGSIHPKTSTRNWEIVPGGLAERALAEQTAPCPRVPCLRGAAPGDQAAARPGHERLPWAPHPTRPGLRRGS
jgi:hypothetical protein